MNKPVKEIVFTLFALSLFMSLLQTDKLFFYLQTYPFFKYFVLVSIVVVGIWIVLSVREYLRRRGIFYYCIQKFRSLAIPKMAKRVIVLVFSVNLIAILFGMARYPFYDVGMFRWSTKFTDKEKKWFGQPIFEHEHSAHLRWPEKLSC